MYYSVQRWRRVIRLFPFSFRNYTIDIWRQFERSVVSKAYSAPDSPSFERVPMDVYTLSDHSGFTGCVNVINQVDFMGYVKFINPVSAVAPEEHNAKLKNAQLNGINYRRVVTLLSQVG